MHTCRVQMNFEGRNELEGFARDGGCPSSIVSHFILRRGRSKSRGKERVVNQAPSPSKKKEQTP